MKCLYFYLAVLWRSWEVLASLSNVSSYQGKCHKSRFSRCLLVCLLALRFFRKSSVEVVQWNLKKKNYIHIYIHSFSNFLVVFHSSPSTLNNAEDISILQVTANLFVIRRHKMLLYLVVFHKHWKDSQVTFIFLLSSKGWLQKKKLLSFSLYERPIPS